MDKQKETMMSSLQGFAKLIHDVLRSDRDVNIGVGGYTGEGKSTFATLLQKTYAKVSKTEWGFERMTWSRKELMKWIDGEGKTQVGQLPQYSAILPDELFHMFYRRTWFDNQQIDAIATFNMCRDRHLFVCGNIPSFWDLDGSFLSRIRFYVYIINRGKAWVFQQENNPFTKDPWNVSENRKIFRKKKHPYSIPNFITEIKFPDWTPQEKREYYGIRNAKRLDAMKEQKVKVERYKDIKDQRDAAVRLAYSIGKKHKALTQDGVADILGLDRSMVSYIINPKDTSEVVKG